MVGDRVAWTPGGTSKPAWSGTRRPCWWHIVRHPARWPPGGADEWSRASGSPVGTPGRPCSDDRKALRGRACPSGGGRSRSHRELQSIWGGLAQVYPEAAEQRGSDPPHPSTSSHKLAATSAKRRPARIAQLAFQAGRRVPSPTSPSSEQKWTGGRFAVFRGMQRTFQRWCRDRDLAATVGELLEYAPHWERMITFSHVRRARPLGSTGAPPT